MVVVGPMVELYIKEFGQQTWERKKDLMPLFTVLVPWQVITSIFKLMVNYDATSDIEIKKIKRRQSPPPSPQNPVQGKYGAPCELVKTFW